VFKVVYIIMASPLESNFSFHVSPFSMLGNTPRASHILGKYLPLIYILSLKATLFYFLEVSQ
jgi:hypothetical protein